MKPIIISPGISKGIVTYFPPLTLEIPNYLLKLEIYYSLSNPLFNWINCDNSEQKIYEVTTQESDSGILFNYSSLNDLSAGFYTLKATLITSRQPREGSLTIGLSQPQPYLVIGLPYSIYPPITLN